MTTIEHPCSDAISALIQIAESDPNSPQLSATHAAQLLRHISDLDKISAEVAPLRRTLKFYADAGHFNKESESDWEAPSGEPSNFLCNEHGDTVEDGTIAAYALADPPRYVIDEDDDEKQAQLWNDPP